MQNLQLLFCKAISQEQDWKNLAQGYEQGHCLVARLGNLCLTFALAYTDAVDLPPVFLEFPQIEQLTFDFDPEVVTVVGCAILCANVMFLN